jgi:hypothetical protein
MEFSGVAKSMGRILRTIVHKGSLAKLMLTIGFHYKSALLIEVNADALHHPLKG